MLFRSRTLSSLSLVAATLASLGVAAPASAELSATGGLVSEYYFRGVGLGDAGAYGSLDYSVAGFTLGTWIIDDGSASNDGLETDFYAGYGMSHGDNFSWNVAYNRYEYTYTSDYEDEIAVSLGLPVGLSLQLVRGEMHDEGASLLISIPAIATCHWAGTVRCSVCCWVIRPISPGAMSLPIATLR